MVATKTPYKMTGSCNAETFAPNLNAYSPYRSGVESSDFYRENTVRVGWITRRVHPWESLWNQAEQGEAVLWDFRFDKFNPQIWVIHRPDFNVYQMWESEAQPHPEVNIDQQPIIFDTPHDDLPSDEGIIQAEVPGQTELEQIETELDALGATVPGWITNTKWEGIPNTTILLHNLFIEKQRQRDLLQMKNLSDLHSSSIEPIKYTLYILLWLRSASQILYNHQGESMIPLAKERFTVNTDGLLSFRE
jgi:hypothetical protein